MLACVWACVWACSVCFCKQSAVAEFRFHFYRLSSADLRQWSVWTGLFLRRKNTLFCGEENKQRCRWNMEGRQNGHHVQRFVGLVWIEWTSSVCRGDEKIMLWQLALFFSPLVYPNAHTHFFSIGCLWESEVMFLVPLRKRATLQVPFQLSLRDRSGYVIAWGNKWHRTRPYIIRLYANTSP